MKVFADFKSLLELQRFGIDVPLTDERALDVAKGLEKMGLVVHTPQSLGSWPELTKEDLLLAHHPNYVKLVMGEAEQKRRALSMAFELVDQSGHYNRYDPQRASLPLEDLADRILRQSAGTYLAAKTAIEGQDSYFLGGGFHHAHYDFVHGFCLVNDIVVALRRLQREQKIKTAWIVDVDAHKGDGTAALTLHDESLMSLSIHMAHGWPLDNPKQDEDAPWFIKSNVDIPIASGEEEYYLEALRKGLKDLENLSQTKHPDLVMIVQGSDPYEQDILPSAGYLKLTKSAMLKRDQLVYDYFSKRQIPQCYVMSGGYGPHVAEIYQQFFRDLMDN